jgi:hypothetical protein
MTSIPYIAVKFEAKGIAASELFTAFGASHDSNATAPTNKHMPMFMVEKAKEVISWEIGKFHTGTNRNEIFILADIKAGHFFTILLFIGASDAFIKESSEPFNCALL